MRTYSQHQQAKRAQRAMAHAEREAILARIADAQRWADRQTVCVADSGPRAGTLTTMAWAFAQARFAA